MAFAATYVAAAPATAECLPLIGKCTLDSDCCSNECIASVIITQIIPLLLVLVLMAGTLDLCLEYWPCERLD